MLQSARRPHSRISQSAGEPTQLYVRVYRGAYTVGYYSLQGNSQSWIKQCTVLFCSLHMHNHTVCRKLLPDLIIYRSLHRIKQSDWGAVKTNIHDKSFLTGSLPGWYFGLLWKHDIHPRFIPYNTRHDTHSRFIPYNTRHDTNSRFIPCNTRHILSPGLYHAALDI